MQSKSKFAPAKVKSVQKLFCKNNLIVNLLLDLLCQPYAFFLFFLIVITTSSQQVLYIVYLKIIDKFKIFG